MKGWVVSPIPTHVCKALILPATPTLPEPTVIP